MSDKIKSFFIEDIKFDELSGETKTRSKWGLFFHFHDSVTEKFHDGMFTLSGVFHYFQKKDIDRLVLNANLTYYSKEKKASGFLKDFSIQMIPDNNEKFILSNPINFDSKSTDLIFQKLHQEFIDFEIEFSDFLKLVNAESIKWQIPDLDDGEFDKMRVMDIKGAYNAFFDPDFETEIIEKYVDERQEELRIYREKKALEDKKKEKIINSPKRELEVQPEITNQLSQQTETVLHENPESVKKTSSNIWLVILLIIGFFIWKRYDNMSKEIKSESTSLVSNPNDTSNSTKQSNNDHQTEELSEPGRYRIDYRLTSPVIVYKDVMKSKKSKCKFSPMQSVNIIKVENGLGYFEDYINYESQKGWVEMNKLVKLEPLYMESIGKRYRVKSSEINGIQVYKDFSKKKTYAKKLEPMEEFEVLYIIEDMGCNVDDILNFKVQWVEMNKLEKQDQ
jgi:hypothetical protein